MTSRACAFPSLQSARWLGVRWRSGNTFSARPCTPQGVTTRLRAALPGLSVELAGDLKDSAIDQQQLANATDVINGLNRLVGIFESRGGPPILIFEDTDAWLGTPDGHQTAAAANQFFSQSLGVLARDVEIR
jgi:hypothetical protein